MNIAVFSSEDCAGCVVVKEALTKANIEYQVKDIMDSDVMDEAMQLGIRGIPVTVFYEDEEVKEKIVGSSPDTVKKILELAA